MSHYPDSHARGSAIFPLGDRRPCKAKNQKVICLARFAVVALAHESAAKERKSRDHARGRSYSHQQGNLKKGHDNCPDRDSSFDGKNLRHQVWWQIHHGAQSMEIGLRLERKKPDVGAEALRIGLSRRCLFLLLQRQRRLSWLYRG